MKATSRLAQSLGTGRTLLTAECLPPRGADATAVRRTAAAFPSAVQAVIVSDCHEGVRSSALATAALLAGEKQEPMLTLLTRDRNRIALESDVLGAAALGVSGMFCVDGTHQTLAVAPQAAASYDMDAIQLCQALRRLRDESVGFAGGKLDSGPGLIIAAAAHPALLPLDLNVLQLRKKVAAGAQLLITDPVTDLEAFGRWLQAVRAAGIHTQAAIVASIPIGDALEPAVELARTLKAAAGVRGLHLLSGGRETTLAQLIREAGLD